MRHRSELSLKNNTPEIVLKEKNIWLRGCDFFVLFLLFVRVLRRVIAVSQRFADSALGSLRE